MVTEDVTIRISERGAKSTARGIGSIGASARSAKVAVAGLLVALAGFVSVRSVARVAVDAIKAAASFEQFGVRLSALLGSQKEANLALKGFTDLASKTPFAVSEIIAGASALGAVALKNRERLEELTLTAANLAAVSGLSFTEAASNLQRALSTGIASADLFRDKGITPLIQAIGQIPDATKLSTQELDKLLADIFGKGGTFGGQAEALSNTLGGALSNIGDAATNTKVALGQAFAPAVVAGVNKVFIPFLKELEQLIRENDVNLRNLAAVGVQSATTAFVFILRAALALAQTLATLDKTTKDLFGTYSQFQLASAEFGQSLNRLQLNIVAPGEATEKLNATIAETDENIKRLRKEVDGYAEGSRAAGIANTKFGDGLDILNEKLEALKRNIQTADLRGDLPSAPDVELPDFGTGVLLSPEQIAAREAAEKKVLQITNQLRVSSAARVSELDAQLERLAQQAVQLREAATASGDEASAREGLLLIDQQIASVRQEQLDKTKEEAEAAAKLRAEAAQEIGGSILEGIATNGESLLGELAAFGEKQFAESFGEAILSLGDVLTDTFEEAFGDIDFGELFGDQSGAIGAAFGAALGIGAQILAKELQGGSSSSRNDLVASAVESAQATRGVVAGPTSIPVFQVGQQIEDALQGTEGLLAQILDAIQAQPVGNAGGGGGFLSSSASSDLSSVTPSLV